MGASRSSSTPAMHALTRHGVPFTVHRYRHDSTTTDFGAEAAERLAVSADRIFKTLIVDADGRLTVAVVPVSSRMLLRSVAAALSAKRARLADTARAERATGYVRGGISPFGQKSTLPTVVDDSCLSHRTVFVSGGRRGLDVEIAPADLLALTNGSTAPLIEEPRSTRIRNQRR